MLGPVPLVGVRLNPVPGADTVNSPSLGADTLTLLVEPADVNNRDVGETVKYGVTPLCVIEHVALTLVPTC